ncbi:YihY/virulence factor BrkB family protein [Oceanobacillus halophilus]|uniref:YihY/virulence factor BrkB family protein n=1 Tax=Oceanobacillus halophilus TaxID=930130 RepID=A0A494ZZ61_9BACI|nr:YihY/virulence factor BrkB family protein [Oceanobacillus halophilus]RKQ31376.1 YihY/virulence factor BrkB family protein [Oceanobacillus halophilus]
MKKLSLIGKQLFKRIDDVDVFGLAAQLAYFFLLSLFPLLLFLLNLIGYLPIDEKMIFEMIGYYAPQEVVTLINSNIDQLLHQNNGGLLSIGIIGTLWAASNAINAIIKAFNRAYNIGENRSFIVTRLIAIVLTIAMVLVIVVSLLLPVFGRVIGEYIFSFFGLDGFLNIWETIRWVLSSVIFFIVLLFLYKLAPNKHIYFRDAIWGTVISTVSWQVVSFGFSFYVNTFANYSVNYGSLGTIIILMIWFYLLGIIIILGGVINSVITKYKKETGTYKLKK